MEDLRLPIADCRFSEYAGVLCLQIGNRQLAIANTKDYVS
jgi:hypothetical protein